MANRNTKMPEEIRNAVNGMFLKQPAVGFKTEGTREEQKRLRQIVDEIANNSPFGKEMLETAAKAGYTLSMKFMHETVYDADLSSKKITLNSDFRKEDLIAGMIRTCRDVQRSENGAKRYDMFSLNVKSAVMVSRAVLADSDARVALTLTQMKENGAGDAYEKFSEKNPALYEALEEGRRQGSDKIGLRAAFDSWYQNADLKTMKERVFLDQPMRDAMRGKDFRGMDFNTDLKSADVIDRICDYKGGRYFDDANALDDGKYLDICEATKKMADKFFEARKNFVFGKPEADASYKNLPVREDRPETLSMYLAGNFLGLDSRVKAVQNEDGKEKILENKKRFMEAQASKNNAAAQMRLAAIKNRRAR